MQKMKKVLISLLACLCVGTAACGFAACKDDENAGTGGTGTGGLGGLGGLGGGGNTDDGNTDDGNTDDGNTDEGGNGGATAQVMVIFDAGYGEFENEADSVQVVNVNSTLTMPTPTRDGYVLNGWQLANGTKWDATQKVTTNVTLYAIWKKDVQEYDVRFNLNYDGAEVVTLSTEEGKVTYIPEREGYVFRGWWQGSDLTTKFNMNTVVTSDGLELYAEWVEEDKASAYLSAPVISVSGNTFTWNEVEGAYSYSVRVYSSSYGSYVYETTVSSTSWDFYAGGYGYGSYTVDVRANGDGETKLNSSYNSVTYKYGMLDSVTGIALDPFTSVLTWNGVENADYYELYIGGSYVSGYLYETKYDMSNYMVGSYSVTVYAYDNGGYQSSHTSTYVNKVKLNTPTNLYCSFDLEDNEYTFSWNSVYNASEYELSLNGSTYTTSYTSYTISGEDIEWNEEDQVVYTVKAKCGGTYLISDASDEAYYDKVDVYTISIDYETYAYYNAPVVSFDLNGGSGTIAPQMVTKDNGLQYPSTIPTYSGYVFTGWYTEASCENLYDFTSEVTGDMTLYAGWYYMNTSGSGNYIFDPFYYNNSSAAYSFTTYGSSSSYAEYRYFHALTSGTYTLYYRNYYSSSYRYDTYLYVYNATQNMTICSNTSVAYDYYYSSLDITVNAGDVIYIRTYRYNSSYSSNFYFYVTGAQLPADGGVVSDYTYDTETKETQESVERYYTADGYTVPTLTATAPANNYDFLGWYDENGDLVTTEKTYTLDSVTGDMKYVAKWVKCYQAGSSFETAKTAELNTGYSVQIYSAGEWAYYKFTPTTTGYYYMYSTDLSGDSQGFLYGSDFENYLAEDDDVDSGYQHITSGTNFFICHELEAGETYYLKVGDLGGNDTCSFTFHIAMAS
ncbi:MAG: hypothetical protein E7357_02790 [Clostridiales bacterium]|nr:hypothetical protein [Clostridiales bacterium]